jgi:hypothetical protein
MGLRDLTTLADAAHVGAAGLIVGFATRFHAAQDARARGNTHDDVPMEPTMYGRLATAMTKEVSRRPSAPEGDDGDNEPMWSIKLVSAWARMVSACGSHALAESEPLLTMALAMLPPKRPTLAPAGCIAKTRLYYEHIAPSLDGLPSLVPSLSAFATDIFPKL